MNQGQKRKIIAVTAGFLFLMAAICLTASRAYLTVLVCVAGLLCGGYFSWLLYYLSFLTKLDRLSEEQKRRLADEKSPLRYYLKYRLSYDWLKLLGILLSGILLCGAVLSAITNHKPREKVSVFLCAYETVPGEKLEQLHKVAGENGILRLSLNCYDFESDKFPTVLAAKGIHDSDLLILDTAGMELYLNGGNALELTSEVLAQIGAGEGVRLQLLNGRPRAIMIYDADDPEYNAQFDLSFLKLSSDDLPAKTDFYLIINGKSIHAMPFAQGQTDAVIDLCKEIFN